ncbi:MAG: anthranilate phosphoribosyltransferase [Candidatus Omnitrophica bacterium]|nr:anthranilate phosphoribosyltransferase [Candidatus Omnitrophota bacterium]
MSFVDQIRPLLADTRVPPAHALAAFTELLELEGKLSWHDTAQAMRLLVGATPTEEDRLAFLRELAPERATGEMLAAAAAVLRELAPGIPFSAKVVFDCCGTGGDRLGLFNFSTLAALVVAAAGVPVAKHGNRAITSGCGSADILTALGVRIEETPEQVAELLNKNRIAFLFAPLFHTATKNVQPLRLKLREEGVATLFNLLGPVTNPARPTHQLVGVFDDRHRRPLAEAFSLLGCRRTWIVSGWAGEGVWMDEVSPCGPTRVTELADGDLRERVFDPSEVGMEPPPLAALKGGDAATNAALAREVLSGKSSPISEAVALNAGVALFVAEATETPREGLARARALLKSGAASEVLDRWVKMTK